MDNPKDILLRKRNTLTKQITALTKSFITKEYSTAEFRLRFNRITTLFHEYELKHEAVLFEESDNEEDETIMDHLRNSFYALATKIEVAERADTRVANQSNPSDSNNPIGQSTFLEKQRQLKLPIATLPKFDGNLDEWFSFKNAFKAMVDSRTDIDKIVKFMYLRGCLVGSAANKISLLSVDQSSYESAWKALEGAYERRRILLAKYIDGIFDYPQLVESSSKVLSEMLDTVRQHVTMLTLLKISTPDYIIVRALEKALPSDIREKWEEALNPDQVPTLAEFYKFLESSIGRLQTMECETANRETSRGGKRFAARENQRSNKIRKGDPEARALVSESKLSCYYCQGAHTVYRCPAFGEMTTQQRWDAVKEKQLCRNCLRKHGGNCKSINCKRCDKPHHTLLHTDSISNPSNDTT